MEIKHREFGQVIFSAPDKDLKQTVELAVKKGVDLSGANFLKADLRGVCFRGAILRGAEFVDSDLRGADMEGADLTDADMMGARL